MENSISPFERFQSVFGAFEDAGANLYLVGGCVRDVLLGREPKDFDFTCDCLPEQTIKILEGVGLKTFPLGLKFGTVSAHVGSEIIEITTHRNDLTNGRHPDVMFTKVLKEDLSRRDFTINSICWSPTKGLIDFFDGRKDLDQKVIRTTGVPSCRFGEDPLRMLRAVRFASQLGFSLENSTKDAIHSYASSILSVSRERWCSELNKLLLGDFVGVGLELMKQTGLLGYMLPEVFPITLKDDSKLPSKNLWDHTKIVVSKAKPTSIVRWAALLHDIAKPQTRRENGGKVHFLGHELLGAELAGGVARRLHMSNDMREALCGLVKLHQRIGDIVKGIVSPNALRRLARDCEENKCKLEDLIELFAADCSSMRVAAQKAHSDKANLLRDAVAEMQEEGLRPRLPKGIGTAIMNKFDVVPGREVGVLKARLESMLIEGEINVGMSIDEMLERL